MPIVRKNCVWSVQSAELPQDTRGAHHVARVEGVAVGLRDLCVVGLDRGGDGAAEPFERELAVEMIGEGGGVGEIILRARRIA